MKKLISIAFFGLFINLQFFAQYDAEIDALLRTHYSENSPGVAVSVIKNGEAVYQNEIGMANLEHGISISDSTAFHIASVSKQFTAYLCVMLAQEGKLSLDDDVRILLPELASLPHKITIAQLANHTHGLPNVSELRMIKGFGSADRMWHQDVVNMALNIETLNFFPGDDYQYNNTGFVLLAEVIARVCKMPFEEALEKYVLNPLSMNATAAISSPNIIVKNRAESYVKYPEAYFRNDVNVMSNGSSGMRTTLLDMTKWAAHFQNSWENEGAPFYRMIQNSQLNDGEILPYGLGLETKAYKGLKAIFHGGGDGGYRAYTLHIPEHDLSVMILGNSNDYWPLAIAYGIVDLYLADELTELPQSKKEEVGAQELKAFEGIYEYCPGTYYEIMADNDSLYLEIVGNEGKYFLAPLGDGEFAYPFYPESKFVFKEGMLDFQIADFVYHCEKRDIVLQNYEAIELQKFTGVYKNDALNTSYEIIEEEGRLVARHPINFDIELNSLNGDRFFSTTSFFGRLDFVKDGNDEVEGFSLSGQNFEGLVFRRIGS